MKVILSSNPYRDHGMKAVQQARGILEKAGVETVLCHPFDLTHGGTPELPKHLQFSDLHEELKNAKMLICFGGDGTILHAAKDATKHGVPILGVNMGSVGFMAELETGEMNLLARIAHGEYTTEERMMLQIQVIRGKQVIFDEVALNDAVLSKGGVARVAELEVYADDVLACELQGDGVIVATPTGSTAYSMAAGGPVVDSALSAFCVTPICPHSIFSRSVLFPPEYTLTVKNGSRREGMMKVSIDGSEEYELSPGDSVNVSRSGKVLRMISPKNQSELGVLCRKMQLLNQRD